MRPPLSTFLFFPLAIQAALVAQDQCKENACLLALKNQKAASSDCASYLSTLFHPPTAAVLVVQTVTQSGTASDAPLVTAASADTITTSLPAPTDDAQSQQVQARAAPPPSFAGSGGKMKYNNGTTPGDNGGNNNNNNNAGPPPPKKLGPGSIWSIPTALPSYATDSCKGKRDYRSACRCIGATPTVQIITDTAMVTVTSQATVTVATSA